MGADNSQTDSIDVSPAGADGDKQLADGKSGDKALIQYVKDPSATVDLYLAGHTCVFENGKAEMDKVPLVNGSVTVPFYSKTSEYVTLTAYLTSDHKVYGSHDFFFSPAVKNVDLEVVPGYGTAPPDGVTPDKVKATVYGYDNQGVAHIEVAFQPNPQAILSPSQPQQTKSDGTATVSITNTVAGDVVMTATSGGVASNPVPVHFGSSTLTVKSVALNIVPQTAPADGTTAVQGTAIVTMSDGSLAPDGMAVTFTPTNGAVAAPPAPSTSGGQGQAKTQITSTAVGASSVTATAGDVSSDPVTVQFTGAGDGIVVSTDPPLAGAPPDGVATIEVTASVTGPNGKPVADGTSVTFSADLLANVSGKTTIDNPTVQTSGGKAKTTVRSTEKGWRTITAAANGETGATAIYFGYGQDVIGVVVAAIGNTMIVAQVYTLTLQAPQGVQLTFTDLSGRLKVQTADGGPSVTNALGMVFWNVESVETGNYPVLVVADNGIPGMALLTL